MLKKAGYIAIIALHTGICTRTVAIDKTEYQKQALSWIQKHVYNKNQGLLVPDKDLQLIANLCYFSFMRSYCTLKAQEKALETLESVWNGWQNIAQTRLNPSDRVPHPIKPQQKKQTTNKFWALHDEHHTIGKTYTQAVEDMVNGEALSSAGALKAVQAVRSSARSIVASALCRVQTHLNSLLHGLIGKKSKKGFSWLSHLWNYVPQLAVKSFAQADALNNTVSEESWQAVLKMQHIGSQTWRAIEEARGSFYLAHYEAVLHVMEKENIAQQYKTIVFDTDGLIPEGKRKKALTTITL